jgi:hypothetical protein
LDAERWDRNCLSSCDHHPLEEYYMVDEPHAWVSIYINLKVIDSYADMYVV